MNLVIPQAVGVRTATARQIDSNGRESDTVTRQRQRRNGNSQGDAGDDYDISGGHCDSARHRTHMRQRL
jgi:hypothetical protein